MSKPEVEIWRRPWNQLFVDLCSCVCEGVRIRYLNFGQISVIIVSKNGSFGLGFIRLEWMKTAMTYLSWRRQIHAT